MSSDSRVIKSRFLMVFARSVDMVDSFWQTSTVECLFPGLSNVNSNYFKPCSKTLAQPQHAGSPTSPVWVGSSRPTSRMFKTSQTRTASQWHIEGDRFEKLLKPARLADLVGSKSLLQLFLVTGNKWAMPCYPQSTTCQRMMPMLKLHLIAPPQRNSDTDSAAATSCQ